MKQQMEHYTNKKDLPKQVMQVISIADDLFGKQIFGIYLYGSSTLGGLRPDSDIDILIIANQKMADEVRESLTKQLLDISGFVGCAEKRPLEVTVVLTSDLHPLKFPPRCEYMYGEWLREEIEAGKRPQSCNDPDIAILLWQAKKYCVTIKGEEAEKIIPDIPFCEIRKAIKDLLPSLIASFKGDERNVLLTLSRMWFTLETGEIGTKDVAAEWALLKLPRALSPLLKTAKEAYLMGANDKWDDKENESFMLVGFMKHQLEALLKPKLIRKSSQTNQRLR